MTEDTAEETAAAHSALIARELRWLQAIIEQRFAARHEDRHPALAQMEAAPAIPDGSGPYGAFLLDQALEPHERLVLILAMAPHLAPDALDSFLLQNQVTGRRFSEFGGILGHAHGGLLPTVETALFLLAGADLQERLRLRNMFFIQHKLLAQRVLEVNQEWPNEPQASATLCVSRQYLEILLTGENEVPPTLAEFPAERISTPLGWDDLVLDQGTREQINMIRAWIEHAGTLMHNWGLAHRLKPGFRCLFHGAPGTGKTLTACLLGQHYQLPVYRVDLSRIASKWIGETEKNLASLFDRAQQQNWILFFDEAEALFGRRTEAHTANDRSANQQIAYLLQRLEDFPGTVILSTNQRSHMDEAFARRFQASILFPIPDAAARLTLWESMFRNGRIALAGNINFAALAEQYPLAGGAIINVLRYACLRAVVRSPAVVELADIMAGVKQESQKAGRYLSN